MASLEELEARLRLLEDEREIMRTMYRFGHSIDYGDEETWVDCFTADGVFEVRSRASEPPTRRVEGRDALRAFVQNHSRAPELFHKHVMVEPLITVDGDVASVVSYAEALVDHEDGPALKAFARYLDSFQREGDGRWRFRERIAEIESARVGLPPFSDGRANRTPPVT